MAKTLKETATPTVKKVQGNVDKDIYDEANVVLKKLGLNNSSAINLFYHQIALQGRIPFELSVPDEKANAALAEVIKQVPTKKLNSKKELMDWLEGADNPDE